MLRFGEKLRRAEGGGTHIRLSLFGARTRPPLCGSFLRPEKLRTGASPLALFLVHCAHNRNFCKAKPDEKLSLFIPPLCGSFLFVQKLKTHLAAGISDFRLEPQLKWHPRIKYIFVLFLRNSNADMCPPRKKSLYFFPDLTSYFFIISLVTLFSFFDSRRLSTVAHQFHRKCILRCFN